MRTKVELVIFMGCIISLSMLHPVLAQLAPGSLEIINPNPVGSGARALGQGNAFIAVADDATAASWNPAGLTQLQKAEISMALEGVYQGYETEYRFDETDSVDFSELNYGSIVFPYSFGNSTHMVFSLNCLNLFQFEKKLDLPFVLLESDPFIQGEYNFNQDGTFAVIAPAFAIELMASLSIGVTFNIWNDNWTHNSSLRKNETATVLVPVGESIVQNVFEEVNEFTVDSGYSWVIGGMYRLSRQWTLAGVIKPAFSLGLDHEQIASRLEDGTLVVMEAIGASVDLDFPWILGAGLAWRPTEPFTVSMDVTWTDWSSYRLEQGDSTVNPITGNTQNLQDAYTVRVGSEYNFVFEKTILPLRLGFGYDPSPAVGEVDEYYTVSFGAGIQFKRIMFDMAYEFRWGNNVNGDSLEEFDATQDVYRHRLLSSVILYF